MSQVTAERAAALPKRAEQAYDHLRHRHHRLLRHALDLEDFQRLARRRLPRAVYGYVANGSEAQRTVVHNREAFEEWQMVTRVLRDVSQRSQATTLFGRRYEAPFGIAPMGAAAVVGYDADNIMARAAKAAGIPFVLSANSVTPMEELVRSNPLAWFAAYQSADPHKIERMVHRVQRAGMEVFVLTADVPVGSNRESDARSGYSMPLRPTPKLTWDGLTHPRWLLGTFARTVLKRGVPVISNLEPDDGINIFSRKVAGIAGHSNFSWKHVAMIRKLWKGPLVVKGVLSPEDARIAREVGVDGIVISNHGGRQLDAAASPIEMLPAIRKASADLTVIIDSGFRRGTDVLKALALGADFVLIGRPFLFASALAGESGVEHAIALLAAEIDTDLALLGLNDPSEAGPEALRPLAG